MALIDAQHQAASMGPPFENGGGRHPSRAAHRSGTDRFNGAAVRKRRRGASQSAKRMGGEVASMGPPFENGGGVRA